MQDKTYDWYNAKPQMAVLVEETYTDCRKLDNMATTCTADKNYRCKYYKQARWDKDRCNYLRSDTGMCDKLIVDGKEIN